MPRALRFILPAATIFALAACGGSEAARSAQPPQPTSQAPFIRLPDPSPPEVPPRCGPGGGRTVQNGILTIATDDPAYEPWFVDNDPANGEGFEGAVARAVADRLGYSPDLVQYVRVGFNEALAPGAKNFDFSINQFTIHGDRRANVDFSHPYYAVAQAVMAPAGSPAASAQSLADLKDETLGAQAGSTSMTALVESIGPAQPPVAFDTTRSGTQALAAGEIDALVVDLPTAVHLAQESAGDTVVVGQFPSPNEVTEFFGLLLEKDSAFTECASIALDLLYKEGVLEDLAAQWLGSQADVRTLE
jgi:polar amino acid transport system substrate-binding protein